ncbi:MAG: hypothetical protein SFX18_03530 [Pirellulales bacterium]|nr:hypothetical protein [Pirellulales bacterium]
MGFSRFFTFLSSLFCTLCFLQVGQAGTLVAVDNAAKRHFKNADLNHDQQLSEAELLKIQPGIARNAIAFVSSGNVPAEILALAPAPLDLRKETPVSYERFRQAFHLYLRNVQQEAVDRMAREQELARQRQNPLGMVPPAVLGNPQVFGQGRHHQDDEDNSTATKKKFKPKKPTRSGNLAGNGRGTQSTPRNNLGGASPKAPDAKALLTESFRNVPGKARQFGN